MSQFTAKTQQLLTQGFELINLKQSFTFVFIICTLSMEHLYISYNSELCLKSKHTSKCVGIQTSTQIMKAQYPPAYVEIKDNIRSQKVQRPFYTLRLKIISRDQQKSQFIVEGSKVHLINTFTDQYVTCSSTGEIKFDKKSAISEEVNKHLYKASTWTIQFLRNQTKVILSQKQLVSVYDDICLKSIHSTYLTLKPTSSQLYASTQVDPTKSVWNLIKSNVPYIPEWVFKRNSFNKFSTVRYGKENQNLNAVVREKKMLKSFTPEKQELLLVEDILDVMLGFDGVYIKKHRTLNQFVIEPHLQQPSCTIANKQLTQKILTLPLLSNKIETYITTYSIQQGIICQALCGGLRTILKEYKTMVVGLDEEIEKGLTLQRLWYLIQPSIKAMEAFGILVTEAENRKGGQLITVLSKLLNQNTDQQIVQLYNLLFSNIVKVYIQMLAKWIYEGIIEDKFGEFMIMTEEKSQNKEWNYWQEKFMIRESMVPSIFAKQANQILVTGKYLNILKACNKLGENPYRKQIYLQFQKYITLQNFSQPIIKAYEWTNKQMLDLVFTECKFNDVLKSIKGYFFLQYGDLFVHFMDAGEQDLSMLKKRNISQGAKTKIFSQEKMQNLFQLLIRTSSANNDPFKDDVTCRVQNSSIYDQMHRIKTLEPDKLNYGFNEKPFVKKDSKYVDFLTIEYKCQFPLNLIFNKKSMSKYQVLFRFLFWCKYIERQLNSVWLALQSTKQIPLPFYTPAYLLNQRMINFIKNFIYYLCYEVIQQNWLVFTQNLKKVQTFQDIIQCHTNFLNKCLVESLLSNSTLLTIITSEVGKACENFFVIRSLINKLIDEFEFQAISTNSKMGSIISQRKAHLEYMRNHIEESLEEQDFRKIIEGYGGSFDDSMRKLLRQVYELIGKQENHLLNLVNRLDQERFYNKRLFGSRSNLSMQ